MRWTRWIAVISLASILTGAVLTLSCTTNSSKPVAMTAEQKIARGRYVSLICACNDCHTPGSFYGFPDTTRRLSGSELGWQGPWGISFPRNLTPDQATGIGSWSESDIVTAVRQGHRPNGTPLLPPMPWPMYANLSDDDAAALAAYLKSIPAVDHKVPDVIPPGGKSTGIAMLTIPPPPGWDGRNLPPPPADTSMKKQ